MFWGVARQVVNRCLFAVFFPRLLCRLRSAVWFTAGNTSRVTKLAVSVLMKTSLYSRFSRRCYVSGSGSGKKKRPLQPLSEKLAAIKTIRSRRVGRLAMCFASLSKWSSRLNFGRTTLNFTPKMPACFAIKAGPGRCWLLDNPGLVSLRPNS